jgi:hypothetical protein
MAGVVYELVNKIIGDNIEKLNPLDSVTKKSAEMINDQILRGAEHVVPGLQQAVDFGSGLEDKAQEEVTGIIKKGEEETGLSGLHKEVSTTLDQTGKEWRKDLGMDEDTHDLNTKLKEKLDARGYNPTAEEKETNSQLARRQYELSHIKRAIEHVEQLEPEGAAKKNKIFELNKLAQEVIDGETDGTQIKYGNLSATQEQKYYENIVDGRWTNDDARLIKWSQPGKGGGLSARDVLNLRSRLIRAAKGSTFKPEEIKNMINLIENRSAKTTHLKIDTKTGRLMYKVSDKSIVSANEDNALRNLQKVIRNGNEFSENMKDNLKFGSADDIKKGILPIKSGALFPEQKSVKLINSTSTPFNDARIERQEIQKLMSDDIQRGDIDVGGRTERETGFNHKLFDEPTEEKGQEEVREALEGIDIPLGIEPIPPKKLTITLADPAQEFARKANRLTSFKSLQEKPID